MLWRCWVGGRKGIRTVKTEWWGAGVVICLERGWDLHMAQLMPLPLTVSCFSKIQTGFTFLVPARRVVAERGPGRRVCYYYLKVLRCVCDWLISVCWFTSTTISSDTSPTSRRLSSTSPRRPAARQLPQLTTITTTTTTTTTTVVAVDSM